MYRQKGCRLPDTLIASSALTPKEDRFWMACPQRRYRWIALSFVQASEDIAEVRKIARGKVGALWPRLERPQALEQITKSTNLSDASW